MSKEAARTTEPLSVATSHPMATKPYNMLVCAGLSTHGTPIYLVAGSAAPATKAQTALRTAYALHGGDCHYCKKPPSEMTIDHVEPKSMGGRDLLHNLVISCKPCNASKKHQVIEAFKPEAGREWLTALLNQVQDRLNRL